VRIFALAARDAIQAFTVWLNEQPEIEGIVSRPQRIDQGVSGFRILW
jgi:hypothetical protein